jgi:septal ring factor EnvC (AmiA/AmiB activator)
VRPFITALTLLTLLSCRSAPTTRQTAESLTDAAQTQTKIDRAAELLDEIENAKDDETRERFTAKYITASKTALDSSEKTIDNLRARLIESESLRGEGEHKLAECRVDSEKFFWIKWLLIIGGPLTIVGAFLLGRKSS